MKHGNQGHAEDVKRQAVTESWTDGNTLKAVASKFGVSETTLTNWRRAYPRENSGLRIAKTARTTAAIQSTSPQAEIAWLRQCLDSANMQVEVLRQIFINQELRHHGYEPTTGARVGGTMTAAGMHAEPNGSALRATN